MTKDTQPKDHHDVRYFGNAGLSKMPDDHYQNRRSPDGEYLHAPTEAVPVPPRNPGKQGPISHDDERYFSHKGTTGRVRNEADE
jgi:hypothetical protein